MPADARGGPPVLRPTPPATPNDVPPALGWLRTDAGLRPVAIARLVGLTPDALARWAAGAWEPAGAEAALAAALADLHDRLVARYPAERARRGWWADARRETGWLSPAELLRRGKLGEVLVVLTADAVE